ncbi:hypothetical protein J4526_04400 [Desulfurococcaceae archaeon MEX13E-LK6-19]|nr:hypothetical protein J4526_04400 [Desulfurococcaceae archaeon MEX13E-LK6-19]
MELDEKHKAILDVLSRYGEINATKIARLAGLHYRIASKKLSELVEMGIVEERRFGRLRLFRIKGKLL